MGFLDKARAAATELAAKADEALNTAGVAGPAAAAKAVDRHFRDLGVLAYTYPGVSSANFIEYYGGLVYGGFNIKASYSDDFAGVGESGWYINGGYTWKHESGFSALVYGGYSFGNAFDAEFHRHLVRRLKRRDLGFHAHASRGFNAAPVEIVDLGSFLGRPFDFDKRMPAAVTGEIHQRAPHLAQAGRNEHFSADLHHATPNQNDQ